MPWNSLELSSPQPTFPCRRIWDMYMYQGCGSVFLNMVGSGLNIQSQYFNKIELFLCYFPPKSSHNNLILLKIVVYQAGSASGLVFKGQIRVKFSAVWIRILIFLVVWIRIRLYLDLQPCILYISSSSRGGYTGYPQFRQRSRETPAGISGGLPGIDPLVFRSNRARPEIEHPRFQSIYDFCQI